MTTYTQLIINIIMRPCRLILQVNCLLKFEVKSEIFSYILILMRKLEVGEEVREEKKEILTLLLECELISTQSKIRSLQSADGGI